MAVKGASPGTSSFLAMLLRLSSAFSPLVGSYSALTGTRLFPCCFCGCGARRLGFIVSRRKSAQNPEQTFGR